jgi:prolyl oligopeptidase
MKLLYPETPQTPVTKTVGGISFEDPYPWLHDDTQEALAWQAKQDAIAKQVCRSWEGFNKLLESVEYELTCMEEEDAGIPVRVGGRWFRISSGPDGISKAIYVSDNCKENGRLLVDTASLSKESSDGRPVHLAFLKPSPDGKLVSFLTMVGGDPMGMLRVVETETGRLLPTQSPFPRHIGPAWCWCSAGDGLLAPGWTETGYHCIRFIPIDGKSEEHILKVFESTEMPKDIPAVFLHPSPAVSKLLAVTSPHEHTARMIVDLTTNVWHPFLPKEFDGECHGEWLDEDTYFAITTYHAPRGKVVAIPVKTSTDLTTWREIVPESDAVLRNMTLLHNRIVLVDLKDVSMRIRLFNLDGSSDGAVPLPPFGSSHLLMPVRHFPHSEELVYQHGGFTTLDTTYQYDFDTHQVEIIHPSARELTGILVSLRFASSKDGTRVPYFLVHRSDLDLSKAQPTLVYAYGGYGAALLPRYLAHLVPFVQAGGVYVQANIRGGSEYGKEWYEGGRLHHKQNTFDDLFAVTEDMIAAGISTPEKLAMQGASNGGMLAGVAITQRPDLWKVVVPLVPILDLMEPANASGAGAPGVPYNEEDYGRLDDPEAARDIFRYSPYHNIHPGVAYPAVCVVEGDKDVACASFHGRRFVARLQAATSSENPILQRVWKDASHGALGRTYIEQCAEWLGFIMQQLGMTI